MMLRKAALILLTALCCTIPAVSQIYYYDADGNPIDEYGNKLETDEYGNVILDGTDNDRYIWGRDTTEEERFIPVGSFNWKIDPRFGNIISTPADTLPDNFQNFNLTSGPTGQYNHLGNLGAPRLSRLFMDRKPYSNFIFADPFDYFHKPIEDFIFTNTLSPLTNLSYHWCGNKTTGEDRVKITFASNINKISGIGFNVDYLYGRGYYNNQATSLFNGTVFGYYLADHYNMHAWMSINHMRLGENGGIEETDYITNPENYTNSYGSRDIPTNLSEFWNRNEDQTYYFNHKYNLGFYKELEIPDSLRPPMPPDSILLRGGLTDSLFFIWQKGDTTQQRIVLDSLRNDFILRQEKPREFVPVTSFIHTLSIRNAKHTVYSYEDLENYYETLYYGDYDDMSNRTHGYAIRNTLGIQMREGFNKWAKFGITIFGAHEYRHYYMPGFVGDTIGNQIYTENDVSVGGQINKTQGTAVHFNATGEFTLVGESAGQFDVEGNADLNFRLFGDTVQLAAKAYVKNLNPSFYMRHYHSQYAWWDNDLDKEFRTRIEGIFTIKRTRTKFTFSVENVKDYTYFATAKTPYYDDDGALSGYKRSVSVEQKNGSIQVLTAKLNQDFKFGIFHWENEIAYQKTGDEDVLPLPDISAYTNIYIVFRYAKVLRIQIGADLRYFTEYYAPDYEPIIQQYSLQAQETRTKIGNYPICNAYINFHLKHCRFYFNANHISDGMGNKCSFLVPNYPYNPMNFHFGLSWNFFD